jgi:hypothetical protein
MMGKISKGTGSINAEERVLLAGHVRQFYRREAALVSFCGRARCRHRGEPEG